MSELIEKLGSMIQDTAEDVEGLVLRATTCDVIARAVLSTLADNLTPEMVEAGWERLTLHVATPALLPVDFRAALTAALRSAVGE